MKKFYIFLTAFAAATTAIAQTTDNVITLDLSKSLAQDNFDSVTGAWNGTLDDDVTVLESQIFSFAHGSMADYQTWWGFTASKSADNSRRDDFITYQYSNMAGGGIAVDSEGKVKLDEYGAPVVDPAMPYLVGFANSSFAKHPGDMLFTTGKSYNAIGVYVNLTTWPYYTVVDGSPYARAFRNGDKLMLYVHGVAADESEKVVEVEMASYTNGCLSICRGWKYVDLTSLGAVNQIWYSMSSTDSGAYGDNTPTFFALDKLSVTPADEGGIDSPTETPKLTYNRSKAQVSAANADFIAIYDTSGTLVASSHSNTISTSQLAPGVYIARAQGASLKIIK